MRTRKKVKKNPSRNKLNKTIINIKSNLTKIITSTKINRTSKITVEASSKRKADSSKREADSNRREVDSNRREAANPSIDVDFTHKSFVLFFFSSAHFF